MAASLRTITLTALVALLAIMSGATARTYKDDKYYSPPPPTYEPPKEEYSPPPPTYEPPKEEYSPPPPTYEPPTEYYPPPPSPYYESPKKYYASPPPKYEKPAHYDACADYADECDFKFQYEGVPTFRLKARGDNAYGPVIVDKYNYPTKVLNANGKCTIFDSYDYDSSCKDNFYFQHNRVATRTFNIRPVEEFKGKCIRLDITSAQLWDNTNLNPYDGNDLYPEDRRCVIFATK